MEHKTVISSAVIMKFHHHQMDSFNDSLILLIICIICTVANAGLCIRREGNVVRDRHAAMARLASYSAKDFRRRFRMLRWQFEYICDLIRSEVEVDDAGKAQAIRSSGSYVCAELRLAATLRILAGGSYLDAGDLYAISTSSIWSSTVWPVVKAICSCSDAPALVVNARVQRNRVTDVGRCNGLVLIPEIFHAQHNKDPATLF
jgi:hypothetical protein